MWSRVSLLIAWGLLVGVVAWSAAQTQALVQTVDADVRVTSERVCAGWLGTYQMLTAWGQRAELVTPQESREADERFRREFDARCDGYTQEFP